MKPTNITQTETDQLISLGEDEFSEHESYDRTMQEKSAGCYERTWKHRKKDQKGDFWIALGLYLIICSVAFVVI